MQRRFIILQVVEPQYNTSRAMENMQEVEQLVATYGGVVVEKTIQHKTKPNLDTYIGSGKIEWLKGVIKDKKIEVVVLNSIVNAGQIFRLEKKLWEVYPQIAVWDRVDLILHIFDQHATTREAKLQIELARVQHLGPRIYGLGGTVLSRQGGGIGTKGLGETNLEIERRNIKKLTQRIQKELAERSKDQERRILERKKLGMKTVALVGYTSAGKTTLFNVLTKKEKLAHKSLFTTLDSIVGKVKISPYSPTILVSDTIGFIGDLPPFLVEAFRSTLLESAEAKFLLHVVDAADPELQRKITVVESILQELKIEKQPILVFNKLDLISQEKKAELSKHFANRTTFFISASTEKGVDLLKKFLHDNLLPRQPWEKNE